VEVISNALSKIMPHLDSAKLRILLITQKMEGFSDIPTMSDLGYKQDLFSAWAACYASAEVKRILMPAIEKAMNTRESKEKINNMGFIVD
jgi:tripartite-type tricarboxylate transporter receptor subunit TctC